MTAAIDPQIVAIMAHLPPYPGARAIPLESLRAYISQTAANSPVYPAQLDSVRTFEIPGPQSAPLAVRSYSPKGLGPWPVTLYFHGGGFALGNLDSQDMICRALAQAAKTVVLSVDYRLAPEHPYPAAAQDALAALDWTLQNAADINGTPQRIAVAGDSAGAELAAILANHAARTGIELRAQLLFYGAGGYPFDSTPSYIEFQEGVLLSSDDVDYYWELYLGDIAEKGRNPDASPRYADLAGVAPAYVLTAELDPIRDHGEDYGTRIRAAGGQAVIDRAPGMIHGFLSFLGTVDEAERAIDRVANWLTPRWA